MRNLPAALSFLLLVPFSSPAQDPAAQAAQQAMQQTQQASQQAVQQAQQFAMQATQQAQQDAQQAMQNATNAANSQSYQPYFTSTPKFSAKPGTYSSSTKVKITDATRGAIIYYTTDGWTPNASSPRYMGPITISSTTTLQAIAIAPNSQRSFVATDKYTLNNSNVPSPPPPIPQTASIPPTIPPGEKILLPEGTPVLLGFAVDVNSHTASVGDQIPMTVTHDVQQDGVVLIKTGTPAVASLVQVEKNRGGGLPGILFFRVDYLDLNGTLIRLCGEAAREGEAKPPNAAVLIPVVGPFTLFRHGTDAVIKQGTPFTAFLYADTALAPAQ